MFEELEVEVPTAYRTGVENSYCKGECFSRALSYVLQNHLVDGIRLIHGRVGLATAHGWVELPGEVVFDGVHQSFYDKLAYYRTFNAVKQQAYTAPEAARLALGTSNYGPWTGGERKQYLRTSLEACCTDGLRDAR